MKTKTAFVNSVSVRVGRLRVKLVTVFRLVQVFRRRDNISISDAGFRKEGCERRGQCGEETRDTLKPHREGVERICAPFIGNNTGSHIIICEVKQEVKS